MVTHLHLSNETEHWKGTAKMKTTFLKKTWVIAGIFTFASLSFCFHNTGNAHPSHHHYGGRSTNYFLHQYYSLPRLGDPPRYHHYYGYRPCYGYRYGYYGPWYRNRYRTYTYYGKDLYMPVIEKEDDRPTVYPVRKPHIIHGKPYIS